jgi:hypothetical protein
MAEKTINVDVVNLTIPRENHRIIPIIVEPNPCYGFAINEEQLFMLIQLPSYKITEAGTNNVIDGTNFYDYFPPDGGGGDVDNIQYRVSPTRNDTTGALEKFKLQVSINSGEWIDVATSEGGSIYDVNLGLFATTATGVDEIGKIKSILLPSYVDDVVEAYYDSSTNKFYDDSSKTIEISPKPGYIYVDITPGSTTLDHSFRWSGTKYVDITNPCDKTTICQLMGLNENNGNGNFDGTGTSVVTPSHGFVPVVTKGDTSKFLNNDGTWKESIEPSDNITLQCVMSLNE